MELMALCYALVFGAALRERHLYHRRVRELTAEFHEDVCDFQKSMRKIQTEIETVRQSECQ